MWENSENISIVLNMYNPKESAINLAVGIQEVNWPHMYGKSYITYINISLQSWPKLPPLYCLSLLDGELVCRAKFLHWGGASLLPFFLCLPHFYSPLLCCVFLFKRVHDLYWVSQHVQCTNSEVGMPSFLVQSQACVVQSHPDLGTLAGLCCSGVPSAVAKSSHYPVHI